MLSLNYFLKSISRSWKNHLTIQLASLLVLSSALTVMFAFYLVFANLERLVVSWGSGLEMNVYLEDTAEPEKFSSIQKTLEEMDKFNEIKFLDRKTTSDNFFRKMSKYVPEFREDDEFLNIVPSSFLVKMLPTIKIEDLPTVAASVMALDGVEDVSYGQEWVTNFSVFVGAIHKTGWTIILILLFGSLFVIGYSIKAIVVQRKEEIEILELVGATKNMIRAPYIFEGSVLGVVSSVFAIIATYSLFQLQDRILSSEMSLWGLTGVFEFYKWYQMLLLIVVGAALGAGTAYFCVKKINSGWAVLNGKA